MEYIINLLQLIGGIILSISYIFQIRQIIKTKSVKDLNEIYLILAVIGVGCMETYAIYNLIKGIAFMFFITNTIALGLGIAMLILYEIYKNKPCKNRFMGYCAKCKHEIYNTNKIKGYQTIYKCPKCLETQAME